MKKLVTVGFFLGLSSMLGCAADFDPGSRVNSFRVLGQEMDVPFAKPGETVNISSLSYDPQGRSVTWAWGACVNPDASTVEGCLNKIATDAAALRRLADLGSRTRAESLQLHGSREHTRFTARCRKSLGHDRRAQHRLPG